MHAAHRHIRGEHAGVRVGGDQLQMTYGQAVGEGLPQALKRVKLTKGKAAFGKTELAAGGRHWGGGSRVREQASLASSLGLG